MASTIPFEPHRFQSAASHYLAGRPAYAARLIARVAELCGLRKTDRVLDLGCGPGPLAVAFAPLAGGVVAMDPEPEMLAAAADAAAAAGAAISFVSGSSYDLAPSQGRFRLAVIGRAFHWMDRVDTLQRLDTMIEDDGAVVLFRHEHPRVPDNAWLKGYEALIDRYAGDDLKRSLHRSPDWIQHEAVLLDSPFNQLEIIGVIERRQTAVENLVERALSMSSTSRGKIGERADELAQSIREAMTVHARNGAFTEVVQSVGLIARRPVS
ncbi:class I SAM-dependent methyltransferase [Reyranella sp. CPCC 100927]|uniref:class I SAM-dependent methyltransferase n=1 Tax=Reyranella sp. CPCC 100927 TaxID=2599616 RepID=UPI0011B5DB21|nr:class I SAM-dependent methyltransferase [Reyranella sp. CPCC 100927]TWT10717.1 class I SAM-dependent methyltransferase [Reyranella sp. CPCC 100927]